ncbi:MAG: acetyl-CoA acetyltransferase [Novosphingobium sp.]|nr:acetyl-CoA acetyltransferase [Novosphingobium sp.]
MNNSPERIPVIIGVGEINDRPDDPQQGLDSAGLMARALERADRDAGGGWIAACDMVHVVPQISWAIDVPASLAALTGIDIARISEAPIASGDTPVRLLNDAANAIGEGRASVVAITGGEALRTAARRHGGSTLLRASLALASPLRRKYGLVNPVELYALYENALRPALGQSLAEGQAESALIWSTMSKVAEKSQGAWLRQPLGADEIATIDASNRPIAFPYTKLMVANSSVNQGAAVIVASLAKARARKVPEDRLVHIGAGAAAHEADEPLERAAFTGTPSMPVAIGKALELNGLSGEDLDCVELYSCFPCVPKLARRILGWPLDRPVSVHGGLTFGGGPIGNYMTHAIAAMVRRLRQGENCGLLFANGGHCSHNHAIVLSRTQPHENPFPQDYDFQAEADAARRAIPPLTDAYEGWARLETYTVVYDRKGEAAYGVALSRSPLGERIIARVDPCDRRSIAFLTDGRAEPVGHQGMHRRNGDMLVWSMD